MTEPRVTTPDDTHPTTEVFRRVHDLIDAREAQGIATYGRTLATAGGRDALRDALEEDLDRLIYLVQFAEERKAVADWIEAELDRWEGDVDIPDPCFAALGQIRCWLLGEGWQP